MLLSLHKCIVSSMAIGKVSRRGPIMMPCDGLKRVEERYAIYLPSQQYTFRVTPELLQKCARKASKCSAPGPDGWTYQEVSALPLAAWKGLLDIYTLENKAAFNFNQLLACSEECLWKS